MKNITLSDLNAPLVVTGNTYYWRSANNASGRRHNEQKKVKEVEEWLKELNNKYQLNVEIINYVDEVKIYKDNKEIGRFKYQESARNVYKKQNFKNLIKLIKNKLNNI